jgi:Mg-chelatase subunit ChlD
VFEVSAGGGGTVLVPRSDGSRPTDVDGARTGVGGTGMTEEDADLVRLDEPAAAADPRVRTAAREIAARLSMRRPRPVTMTHRGSGTIQSVPFRGGLDDIDLDRTVEVLASKSEIEDEDIVVRERVQRRRSVVLAVDLSGSMRDERIRTAAATVGALAGELRDDDLAVVAFWSDAAWLSHFGGEMAPQQLLDALLAMPTRGLTNIELPLTLAAQELARASHTDARVLLLSDCVHNAGPDPRAAAMRLPRLDVMLDVVGEKDLELGRQLARLGRGRLRRIRDYRDAAPALTEIFAP